LCVKGADQLLCKLQAADAIANPGLDEVETEPGERGGSQAEPVVVADVMSAQPLLYDPKRLRQWTASEAD
jgi:hypothetical protein